MRKLISFFPVKLISMTMNIHGRVCFFDKIFFFLCEKRYCDTNSRFILDTSESWD